MLQTNALPAATLAALNKLMDVGYLSDRILVGGTGLALYLGHQLSVDIDLFSPEPLDVEQLISELRRVGKTEYLNNSPVSLHLLFDDVKTDIVKYPYRWIRPVVQEQNIRLASVEDIAAMKLAAITNRGSKKDFYDIYFLLQTYSLPQLLDFFREKFPEWNIFMVLQSLSYFEDAEPTETPKILKGRVLWEDVKKTVAETVRKYT